MNAYLLYKKFCGTISQVWFRLEAIHSLVMYFDHQPPANIDKVHPFINHKAGDVPLLSCQHYQDHLPAAEKIYHLQQSMLLAIK